MRGLDLVGVDFQHRLRVDLGGIAEQEILVRQVRVAAVGTGADDDAAMEHRASATGAKAAPEQLAGRVAGDVSIPEAGVEVTLAGGEQHAVGMQFRACALPV